MKEVANYSTRLLICSQFQRDEISDTFDVSGWL